MHTQATPQQIQHLQQQVAALTSSVQLLAALICVRPSVNQ